MSKKQLKQQSARPLHKGHMQAKSKKKNANLYVQDMYTQKAVQDGYEARSVFKLKEINESYRLLQPGMKVLDLGAAPGSWSRYTLACITERLKPILKTASAAATNKCLPWLCAVDLQPIHSNLLSHPYFSFYQCDFNSEDFQNILADKIGEYGQFDVIISDMAPQTTGNRTVDTARSENLIEMILACIPSYLRRKGTLLFKLFQGGGERTLLQLLQSHFRECHCIKPKAVRSRSFEVYFLCIDYIGDVL